MTQSTPNPIGFWAVQGRILLDDEDTIGCPPPKAMTRADARQWFIDCMRELSGDKDADVIIVGEAFSQSPISLFAEGSIPRHFNTNIYRIYEFLGSLDKEDPRIDTLTDFIVNHLGDD